MRQLAPLAFAAQNAGFALAPNGRIGTQSVCATRAIRRTSMRRSGSASSTYSRLTPGTSTLALDAYDDFVGVSIGAATLGSGAGLSARARAECGRISDGVPWHERAGRSVAVPASRTRRVQRARTIGLRRHRGTGERHASAPASWRPWCLAARRGSRSEARASFIEPWAGLPRFHTLLATIRRRIDRATTSPGSTMNLPPRTRRRRCSRGGRCPRRRPNSTARCTARTTPALSRRRSSLVEKPDDYSAFTLGFQSVFTASRAHIRVFRGEMVNGETSHQERGQRGFTMPLPIYIHSEETQGHTVDGLILGSPEAYGGRRMASRARRLHAERHVGRYRSSGACGSIGCRRCRRMGRWFIRT